MKNTRLVLLTNKKGLETTFIYQLDKGAFGEGEGNFR